MIQHHELLEHCFCDAEIALFVSLRPLLARRLFNSTRTLTHNLWHQFVFPDANAQYIYQYTYLLVPGKYASWG